MNGAGYFSGEFPLGSWKNEYSVGVPALDDQHKELFRLLDELSAALEGGNGVDIDYAVTKLHVYTLFHFSSEEHLMAKYGYEDLAGHIAEHGKFKQKVAEFRRRQVREGGGLAAEIRDFIREWITDHILKTDKYYGPYLSDKVKN